jgi:hypothetical protein
MRKCSAAALRLPTSKVVCRRSAGIVNSVIDVAAPEDAAQFDVFLSYQSGDAEWVAGLKNALEAKGIRVWIDQDQIRPGDLFIDALERGIRSSRCVALIVSPASVRSPWVREEYNRALTLSHTAGWELRLIPVLLRDAELPGFLASRSWVDFRDPSRYPESVDRLAFGITGKRAERPARPPLAAPAASSAVDEIAYLERAIGREALTLRKLRTVRLAAPAAGIAVYAAAAAALSDLPSGARVALGITAPLVTGLIGWGSTVKDWTASQGKIEKLYCLRDGLELCRGAGNEGCARLRATFWKMVERSAGAVVEEPL